METKDMTITQVVDVTHCKEKAAIYKGMATAVLDKESEQVCSPRPDASDSAVIN